MKTIIAIVLAASLAGCAHGPQLAGTPPQHHVRKAAPVAPPPVVVAPVAPLVTVPSPKQTFKQRWLRKFFRDRAAH